MAVASNPLLDSLRPFIREVVREVAAEMMAQQPATNRLVGTKAAAAKLGCSAATIRNKVAAGELHPVRYDRYLRFDMRELEAFQEANR